MVVSNPSDIVGVGVVTLRGIVLIKVEGEVEQVVVHVEGDLVGKGENLGMGAAVASVGLFADVVGV